MRQSQNPTPTLTRRAGFSLVELLTVIAIISILMSLAVVGLNSMTGGRGVSTAVSGAEAVFDEARSLAMGRRTSAAVLVSVQDPNNRETYLRRLVVVYKEVDPLTNLPKGDWILSSRGVTLPDKVYYSTTLSKRDHSKGTGALDTITLSGVKREYSGEYVIYEFNQEGICTTPGASFVVGMGARDIGAKRPRTTGSAKRDFGGFVVWRNGATSLFRDPAQILTDTNIKNF